jgi:hypothetical protein
MPCTQWCRLIELYRGAVDTYSEATKALSVHPGAAFNETWQRAERARTRSESCRADVLHHEHDHACLEGGKLRRKAAVGISTENFILGDQGQSGG